MIRRIIFVLLCLLLMVPVASAQELADNALESAINRANQLIPNLGRPSRWEFEILLPSTDSAAMCPLVPGYKTETTRRPFIVTLFYDNESGNPDTYVFHAAGDGSIIQPCDPKFSGSIGMSALSVTLPQAADACTVTPGNGEFANARVQPDVDAEQLGTITEGQVVLGRNDDTTWYLTQSGWVAGTVVNTSGDCNPNIIPARNPDIMLLPTGTAQTPSDGSAPPPATAAGTPVAAAPSDFTCPPNFTGYLPPRIQRGSVTAQVEAGGIPNTIRSLPTVNSERIGQIQPNRRLDFVWNGPRCSEGYVWWEVEIDGVRGWTAESSFSDDQYFLEPTTGNAVEVEVAPTPAEVAQMPSTFAPISAQNLASVRSLPPISNTSASGWYADDQLLIAVEGGFSVLPLGAMRGSAFGASVTRTSSSVTALAGVPEDTLFAIGEENGTITLYADSDRSLQSVAAHTAPVNTIAFTPDGSVMATGSGDSAGSDDGWTLRLWDVEGLAVGQGDGALLRAIRFPYPVRDAAFSADGGTLAIAAGTDDGAALWIYDDSGGGDNMLTVVLDNTQVRPFVTAVPQALDGDFVYARGSALYSLTIDTGAERLLYEQSNLLVTDVAFQAGLMFVTNTSEQATVPLYVYEYAQFANGEVAARVLDSVAADGITVTPSGSAFAAQLSDGSTRVYAVTQ